MSKVTLIARLLLGIVFFVFGLNGFLGFIPMPPPPPAAGAFMAGLLGSGYFFPFLKGVETLSGLLLLSGLFVPLALTVLAPIVINIILFHAFLEPAGLPLPIVIAILEVYLIGFAEPYRKVTRPLLKIRP